MIPAARLVTKSRLPSNLGQFTDIGPAGLNLLKEWSFNNGVRTITNANSSFQVNEPLNLFDPGRSASSVKTDSDGNIIEYEFSFVNKNNSLYDIYSILSPAASILLPNSLGTMLVFNAMCKEFARYGESCKTHSIYEDPGSYALMTYGHGKWYTFDDNNESDSFELVLGGGKEAFIDLAAGKIINGEKIMLGQGGNSSMATAGLLPKGFVLNSENGQLNVSSDISSGKYVIPYRVCESITGVACASYISKISVKNKINSVPVTTHAVPTLSQISIVFLSMLIFIWFMINKFRAKR